MNARSATAAIGPHVAERSLDRVAALHSRLFVLGGAGLIAAALALRALGIMPQLAALMPWLAALALVGGLPHGALDPWISHRAGSWCGWRGALGWHARYVAIATLVVGAFIIVPTLALAGFLVLAVTHFADDWNGEEEGCAGLSPPLRILPIARTTERRRSSELSRFLA